MKDRFTFVSDFKNPIDLSTNYNISDPYIWPTIKHTSSTTSDLVGSVKTPVDVPEIEANTIDGAAGFYKRGACKDSKEIFTGYKGRINANEKAAIERARQVCGTCAVQAECLGYGISIASEVWNPNAIYGGEILKNLVKR